MASSGDAHRDLWLPAQLARLDRVDLLILDDFSYVRRDQAESSVLFELISERNERKSTAITANQPFSAWDQVFPEAAMTVAAVDRLVHHSTIFDLNAESYRCKAAEGKAAGMAKVSPRKSSNRTPSHRPRLLSFLARIVDVGHPFTSALLQIDRKAPSFHSPRCRSKRRRTRFACTPRERDPPSGTGRRSPDSNSGPGHR